MFYFLWFYIICDVHFVIILSVSSSFGSHANSLIIPHFPSSFLLTRFYDCYTWSSLTPKLILHSLKLIHSSKYMYININTMQNFKLHFKYIIIVIFNYAFCSNILKRYILESKKHRSSIKYQIWIIQRWLIKTGPMISLEELHN